MTVNDDHARALGSWQLHDLGAPAADDGADHRLRDRQRALAVHRYDTSCDGVARPGAGLDSEQDGNILVATGRQV